MILLTATPGWVLFAVMSSYDSMNIVFKCLSKGAVDFLAKPIRKNELKNLWQHVWRKCHSVSCHSYFHFIYETIWWTIVHLYFRLVHNYALHFPWAPIWTIPTKKVLIFLVVMPFDQVWLLEIFLSTFSVFTIYTPLNW